MTIEDIDEDDDDDDTDAEVCYLLIRWIMCISKINVKNFHGSLTTVVRAQNDTSKTANITDTIFDRTLV